MYGHVCVWKTGWDDGGVDGGRERPMRMENKTKSKVESNDRGRQVHDERDTDEVGRRTEAYDEAGQR